MFTAQYLFCNGGSFGSSTSKVLINNAYEPNSDYNVKSTTYGFASLICVKDSPFCIKTYTNPSRLSFKCFIEHALYKFLISFT